MMEPAKPPTRAPSIARAPTFDHEPIFRARARHVFAVRALRHDAFEALALGFLEELRARCEPVAAECDELVLGQNGFETLLAFRER
jgi:hypothetical protein